MWRRLISPRPAALTLLTLGAIAYPLLSVVNHLCFHTFGLDLGLYTHALFNYAHLQADPGTFYLDHTRNLLSDHFDLYLPLLSPLVWLFGEYTLLLVQIAAVLLGAWGVYRWLEDITGPWIAVAAMASFLSFFGIWQALAFDYHSNVVACMWIPWMMLALRQEHYVRFALLAVLVSLAKETMPLWLLFVLLPLLWDYRHNRRTLLWIGGTACFCIAYFLLVSMVIMPALCPDPAPGFWRYAHMGDSLGQVASWIVTHPLEALQSLLSTPDGQADKREFYLCFLLSGGLLLLRKPHWLLLTVPLIGQKMLSCDQAFWGIAYHYNVEFALAVPLAFIVIGNIKWTHWRYVAASLLLVSTILTTAYTTSRPHTWIRTENVRLLDAHHFRQDAFDLREAHRCIGQIPSDAAVCASSCLTPHLVLRKEVYLYPMGLAHNPDLLLLTPDDAAHFHPEPHWLPTDTLGGLVLYTHKQ